MKAAVSVRLGILYVILFPDKDQLTLPLQRIYKIVYIINKVADHTDPGDIPEMILGVLHTVRMSQLLQLLFDALLGFDPFLDIVDRRYGRLLIQASVEHLKLGAHDLTCVLIWLDTIVILFVCHENPSFAFAQHILVSYRTNVSNL